MMGEFPRALTAASGLISLAIGFYVFMSGRRRLVNNLFFLMTIFLAIWALAEAMTMAVPDLSSKIFWTKFQGIGELLLVPTYLLIALYFPRAKGPMSDRRKAFAIISGIYAPFILGLILLYSSNFVYRTYLGSTNISKITVERTSIFWLLNFLGITVVFAAIGIFLWERENALSPAARKGLLILALAPIPMLIANIIQNYQLSPYVTATQASFLFVAMLAYGVLRYGLFVDLRSMTKRVLIHASVIIVNVSLFALICAIYIYALDLGRGFLTFVLILLTAVPFMLAYDSEVKWIRSLAVRYLSGREEEESRLLEELSSSIRTVGNLMDLAERIAGKVRESLALTGCGLMVKEGDLYKLISYAYQPDSLSAMFKDVVKMGLFFRKWPGFFSYEDDEGVHSGYWALGDEIRREEYALSRLRLGILRINHGNGEVDEFLWGEEKEGEAICVPLEVAGEEVGLLWMVASRDRVRFSLEECDFIMALSTQAAVSLKNAQLLQELLDKSNRLQELIQGATTAQEEERIRISRELHDGLAPYFLEIIYQLDMLEDKINEELPFAGSLDEIREKAREGLRDLRQIISALRPSSLDVLGLEKSLATYLERFGIENGVEVQFDACGDLGRLDPLMEITAFRIAQEALSNIGRHARAAKVSLCLVTNNGSLEMVIEDDGVGFLEKEVKERMLTGDCLGIKGMRERAELMQADFRIDSQPGEGTKLQFAVPLGTS